MSIILDALRKSEAARRRNQAPELFAETHDRAPAMRARTRWPMWKLVGFSALGVGALAIALWSMTRMTTTPSATENPANAANAVGVVNTESVDASVPNANADVGASAGALAPPFEAPDASASAPTPPMPLTEAGRAPAVVQPLEHPADAPDTMPSAPSIAPTTAQPIAAPPKPATTAVASQNTVAVAPSVAAPPPAFRSPGNDAPMALGDLDAETRNQLPPLKLSMHMWHDAPAQRFVILDGQRLREGDVIGDVVIERITRDGATLSWRGTALKIEWR